MKIAINTRFLLADQLEGFGWYTHEIVNRMVLQHPEHQFLFLFDRAFDNRFIYADNVIPIRLFPPARHPLLFYWWFEWSVPRALKRHGAQVFFSPDSMCSLGSKTPTVMTVHDLVPLHRPEDIPKKHRWYLTRFLPKFINRADHILTVSQYVKQDIELTKGISPAKISTVYNGSRAGFKPVNALEARQIRNKYAGGQSYFIYTGAIHPRKNITRLIQAFDLFRNQCNAPVKLLLAGRFAWQTGEIVDAHNAAVYKSDIVFLGYIDDEILHQITAAALAMIYPSLDEGFGLPIVEAMNAEVPVMIANASCLPEIAGDAAIAVDGLSYEAMAQGLRALYEDPLLRQKLIDKGRIQRQKFDWDMAATQVYDCLMKTAGSIT